ncbi:RING-type domain-containing protein [Mycena venus]|uniref:RING-type domain-containing protein n=1 Tax=Mycena venus TaxID=2733690 RepID=A0A8H7CNT8_9AGAR|nr:RING-type domain-containing protein [Mycena venus]
MSKISSHSVEFNFWDFVCCSRCQLPFASNSTVPFWVTDCGHVVCKTHLTTDRRCTQCGATGIQLLLLQREIEDPMSTCFQSIPYSLDTVAYTAKVQQETMAFQIRYYQRIQRRQQDLIGRLKWDVDELKRNHSALTQENAQYRQSLGYQAGGGGRPGPSSAAGSYGMRRINGPDHYRPRSSTSRSTVTSLGPGGPTAPLPSLISNGAEQRNPVEISLPHARPPRQTSLNAHRPGSSRLFRQHSYVPPSTARSFSGNRPYSSVFPLTAHQSSSQPHQRQLVSRHGNPQSSQVRRMVTTPSFHPAQRRNMGPPLTPIRLPPLSAHRRTPSFAPDNRFPGPSPQFTPLFPQGAARRFPADGADSAGTKSMSRAPSRRPTSATFKPTAGGMR